jgi:hypothetical protein
LPLFIMPSEHPETIVPLLFQIELSLLAVSIIVVCGRFYSRSRILHAVGADDWCILSAGVQDPLQVMHLRLHLLTTFYCAVRPRGHCLSTHHHDSLRLRQTYEGYPSFLLLPAIRHGSRFSTYVPSYSCACPHIGTAVYAKIVPSSLGSVRHVHPDQFQHIRSSFSIPLAIFAMLSGPCLLPTIPSERPAYVFDQRTEGVFRHTTHECHLRCSGLACSLDNSLTSEVFGVEEEAGSDDVAGYGSLGLHCRNNETVDGWQDFKGSKLGGSLDVHVERVSSQLVWLYRRSSH